MGSYDMDTLSYRYAHIIGRMTSLNKIGGELRVAIEHFKRFMTGSIMNTIDAGSLERSIPYTPVEQSFFQSSTGQGMFA